MPKVKRSGAKRTSTSKAAAKPKTPRAAKPKADSGAAAAAAEQKRIARESQNATQLKAVVDRVINGDEKLSAVASDLKITSGKAAFLIMQHRVAQGEVPKITGKGDEGLLKNINTARLKADEHSSWGWLAARSGRSEGWIKTGLEKAGLFKPRAENIASKRAAAKPKVAKTAGKGKKATGGGKKTVRGNA